LRRKGVLTVRKPPVRTSCRLADKLAVIKHYKRVGGVSCGDKGDAHAGAEAVSP
jgi:hypothetical protein